VAQQSAKPVAPHSAVSRVGCVKCPASLRIIADMDCNISVDGEKVGRIAQDAGKTVEVGLGQHMIVAQNGDLKWQTTFAISKPGQVLVKTDLRSMEKANELAKAWQGDWQTHRYYYNDPAYSFSYYFDSFEIKVEASKCTITWEDGYATSVNGPPNSYATTTNSWPCTLADDGSVTFVNNVKATGEGTTRNLTYTSDYTHQTHSLHLYSSLAGQSNAQDESDPLKIATRAWAGDWSGEASTDDPVAGSTSYRTEQESLTIHVALDGSCTAARIWTSTFHYHGGDGDNPVVTPHYGIRCNVIDAEKLNLYQWGGPQGTDVLYIDSRHAAVTDNSMGTRMNITLERR